MAFEIYNGTGSGLAMFEKLNEMWEFDSYDDTSGIVATYGNAKFEVNSNGMVLYMYNDTTQLFNQEVFGSPGIFTIIKSDSSIMLSWLYGSYIHTIIIGNLTDVEGNTGKGAVLTLGQSGNNHPYYMVAGEESNSGASNTLSVTDVLTQLVPQVCTRGGWAFDNAYRSLFDTSDTKRGLYTIGNERYYISGRTAIKEE